MAFSVIDLKPDVYQIQFLFGNILFQNRCIDFNLIIV
jgi:hypothetical protein